MSPSRQTDHNSSIKPRRIKGLFKKSGIFSSSIDPAVSVLLINYILSRRRRDKNIKNKNERINVPGARRSGDCAISSRSDPINILFFFSWDVAIVPPRRNIDRQRPPQASHIAIKSSQTFHKRSHRI